MPPLKITVVIVMTQVVVKNIWRTSVTVFLKAKAKAIAPLSPENQSMCWNYKNIGFQIDAKFKYLAYVDWNLMLSAAVDKAGKGVDVKSSSNGNRNE